VFKRTDRLNDVALALNLNGSLREDLRQLLINSRPQQS
jgi:hypothetical protein